MNKVATKTFTAEIVKEGSWGGNNLGMHESTMDLYRDGSEAFIEWDIPDLEITEVIGIWLDGDTLTDYDGVMSLPKEAIQMLRDNGITVPEDFE